MSIADLSKEVDNLAKIIINKNAELEQLKKRYDSKIKIINDYISKIRPESVNEEQISDEQFVNLLNKDVKCTQCGHQLNNKEEDEFLLIPKNQIQYLLPQGQLHTQPILKQDPNPIKPIESKSKKKNHIICSFCKESGHTRAKCHKKLGIQTS
ncbi:hypothetical protein KGF54_002281 [Candida jiufengensis]|uniref:uncharacterized protein n=1 Tax=Candida jiufengensis TaxID=497108 RepID=UPI00222508F7|nr:uncharacterized protein KGF54_002281 [Candida jiufengensis]KAI5954506.1 hypothetical protein KGF54_002281 [Candida jiufengensis]